MTKSRGSVAQLELAVAMVVIEARSILDSVMQVDGMAVVVVEESWCTHVKIVMKVDVDVMAVLEIQCRRGMPGSLTS